MNFNETETAKTYGLKLANIEIEIVKPGNLTKVPTVLIIPNEDEFPIEAFEFETMEEAEAFSKQIKRPSAYADLTQTEEELYDLFFELFGDDDFYTTDGLFSADMLVMHVEENYSVEYAGCRVEDVANLVADYVNKDK